MKKLLLFSVFWFLFHQNCAEAFDHQRSFSCVIKTPLDAGTIVHLDLYASPSQPDGYVIEWGSFENPSFLIHAHAHFADPTIWAMLKPVEFNFDLGEGTDNLQHFSIQLGAGKEKTGTGKVIKAQSGTNEKTEIPITASCSQFKNKN